MKVHARLLLVIAILVLTLPALLLACGGEEPSSSTPALESRPTEAAGTGNGGEGGAGVATPTEAAGTGNGGEGDVEVATPTEAAGTGNGDGGDAGRATPTEAPGATGEVSAMAGVGVVGDPDGQVTKGKFASVSAGGTTTPAV